MKLYVEEHAAVNETEITIRCQKVDGEVAGIVALLGSMGRKITGSRDGRFYPLETENILYIDTVDRRTFLYTKDEVYETPMRLYELEDLLRGSNFLRAAKATVLNITKIESLAPTIGGRMEAVMQNGERLTISRQYSQQLKQKIGLR